MPERTGRFLRLGERASQPRQGDAADDAADSGGIFLKQMGVTIPYDHLVATLCMERTDLENFYGPSLSAIMRIQSEAPSIQAAPREAETRR